MPKKLLALVKWCGGEDDRTYTAGMPIEWIKSFDYEEFMQSSNKEETYVIEWRVPSKEPLGGWDCFDGFVIDVSDRLNSLKQKLNLIDGVASPTKVWESSAPSKDTSRASPTNDGNENQSSKARLKQRPSLQKTPETRIPPPSRKQRRLELEDSSDEERGTMDGIESNTIGDMRSYRLMKQVVEGNQKMASQLAKLCKELKHRRKKPARDSSSDSSDSDSSDSEPTVRIGPKKSQVYVSISQWRCAKAQATYTAMGISLLMALFPIEVLLRSNLKGGSRKIKGSESDPKLQALDKKIREAIFYTVETSHPKTFSRTGLGIAINNKLVSLRRAEKKATEAAP